MNDLTKIINSVGCTFAQKSKVSILPKFSFTKATSLNIYVQKIIKEFIVFSKDIHIKKLDILAMEIDEYQFGNNLVNLSNTVFTILNEISRLDPKQEDCMSKRIDDKEWTFTFNGEVFYIVTLSPAYKKNSSRYAYGSKSTFILFQPKISFQRQHLPGKTEIKEEIKKEIRKNFKSMGQAYDLSITLGSYECYKIVKPLEYGDEPIKWWN